MDDGEDLFAFLADEGESGRTGQFSAVAAFLGGELDVLDQFEMSVQVQELRVPAIDLAGLGPSFCSGQVPEQTILAREGVDEVRDSAGRSEE